MIVKPLHARPVLLLQIRVLNKVGRFFTRIGMDLDKRGSRLEHEAVRMYVSQKSSTTNFMRWM